MLLNNGETSKHPRCHHERRGQLREQEYYAPENRFD
jgi:hypothetical protein